MFCKMNLSENKTNGTGDGLTAAGIRSGVDNYTFVVDSNAALLAWANNTAGGWNRI